jgi:hypothetical protein
VVRVGHDFSAASPLHEHAGTNEDDLVSFRTLFAATFATIRAAEDIRDGNASTVMKSGNLEVRRHL